MKITVSVNIPSGGELLVKEGENIHLDTPLINVDISHDALHIALSEILHVNPQKISKFMKKKIGDNVESGELIAEKKGLFSSVSVKSPSEGVIEGFDLKNGNLILQTTNPQKKKILSTLKGRVKSINDKDIVIESEARSYTAESGSGGRVTGKLHHIKGENIGVLDVIGDFSRTIVMMENVTDAAIAKIDALGGKGLVAGKDLPEPSLPFLFLSKSIFSKVLEEAGKEVIIDPENKKLYIPE